MKIKITVEETITTHYVGEFTVPDDCDEKDIDRRVRHHAMVEAILAMERNDGNLINVDRNIRWERIQD